MTTLETIYQKFGETADAAQILENEIGNILMQAAAHAENLIEVKNPGRAREIMDRINRMTLGQLFRAMTFDDQVRASAEELIQRALLERNRLSHSFFREHNLRRNSAEGRAKMLEDLLQMHKVMQDALELIFQISGTDLTEFETSPLPSHHLQI
jgi:hypothetical protein